MAKSLPLVGRMTLVAAMGLALGACASGGVGGLSLPGSQSSQDSTPAVQQSARDVANAGNVVDQTTMQVLANAKQLSGYCPTVSVLGDTNVFQTYAKGQQGNAQGLIHQATITQTARECTALGAEMFIKVGVAGRVLSGPKGMNSSKAVLPLRIVVRQDDNVLYTKLHKVSVSLTPPDRSALFAKVDEMIAIDSPQERNVKILVGFDASGR